MCNPEHVASFLSVGSIINKIVYALKCWMFLSAPCSKKSTYIPFPCTPVNWWLLSPLHAVYQYNQTWKWGGYPNISHHRFRHYCLTKATSIFEMYAVTHNSSLWRSSIRSPGCWTSFWNFAFNSLSLQHYSCNNFWWLQCPCRWPFQCPGLSVSWPLLSTLAPFSLPDLSGRKQIAIESVLCLLHTWSLAVKCNHDAWCHPKFMTTKVDP